MKATDWVWQLSEKEQAVLKKEVEKALAYIEDESERKYLVETAMESRVGELEDTIDLTKYL